MRQASALRSIPGAICSTQPLGVLALGDSPAARPGGPFPWAAAGGSRGRGALPRARPQDALGAARCRRLGSRGLGGWSRSRPAAEPDPVQTQAPSSLSRGPAGWKAGPGTEQRTRQGPRWAPRPRFSIRKKHAVQPQEPWLRRGRVK